MVNRTPGGRCHRVLAHLASRDASLGQLIPVAQGDRPPHRKDFRKLRYAMDAMLKEQLVYLEDRNYVLSPAGARELERLDWAMTVIRQAEAA